VSKKLRFLLIPAVIILSGCGSTKIGRILADPGRYQNRSVTVEGNVTNVVGAYVAGVYQVEDETGKIYVVSMGRGVPNKGVRVRVNGNVTPGLNAMGKSWGTAIRERDHKVRF
jgi:hypothetical protein